jgi:hypothetical protein
VVGSTSISSLHAGGRATPGTGPHFPTSAVGVAEAGEVDRRIQIPIDARASIAAAVGAITQRELGFRPATHSSNSRGACGANDNTSTGRSGSAWRGRSRPRRPAADDPRDRQRRRNRSRPNRSGCDPAARRGIWPGLRRVLPGGREATWNKAPASSGSACTLVIAFFIAVTDDRHHRHDHCVVRR